MGSAQHHLGKALQQGGARVKGFAQLLNLNLKPHLLLRSKCLPACGETSACLGDAG